MAGVRRGAFTCVGWQVTLCDPIWQVTSRSSEMELRRRAISVFTFYLFCWGDLFKSHPKEKKKKRRRRRTTTTRWVWRYEISSWSKVFNDWLTELSGDGGVHTGKIGRTQNNQIVIRYCRRYHVMISTVRDWSVERAQMIYCFDSPPDLFLPSLSVAKGAICHGMSCFKRLWA